ncbi:fimbria/pilus outer membrane usher protein [Acinetobacter nosocomialis]|uniref:Fimbrial biogenesis outer membrane usher protein n=14 Tax=Acinetobacter nosocomialis TaxID=106654 RepID=A0A2L1VFA2_ACINO|nr:fimbria/pilus outer membrane usher protein [Acinetobacter nosocomialis]AVF43874.1 fimbrial biogenesis outer membrane usher protein [Acinetobacter nosocomialis]MBM9549610.1 fimbrial biogenesis outer membrane usher protein [Acinetobacter nosocomialis]MBP1500494.1 fimbrial biogenesis outer membrane usher protein [Acinetobacter nosocomialis]MCJ9032655.1 fimbria/pilus outer membrane usher protein [Acinetobacter nosocomialis]MCU4551188.1 fimbria/pilus outer membrane usher protein [Acinetobacter n
MKYIIGVLCVAYFPAHSFAEQLVDHTNTLIPSVPESIDGNNKYTQEKTNGQEQNLNFIQLFLNISINSNPSEDLFSVKQSKDGKLYIRSGDLKTLRVKMDEHIPDSQWVCINQLKGIQFKYLENEQSLNLQVPASMLTGYSVELSGQQTTSSGLLKMKPLNAAILNYSLYHTITNDESIFSGSAEGIFNSALGNFSSGVLYNGSNETSYSHEKWVRLESKWQYVDPEKVRIYTLGDFVSNSSDWGSSVRLAGFQWSSAYTQRGDIVTSALPQFSGSAALPSTLDLYVNQQKIYSGLVPSGPFDIKQLPFISGNEVTLVTTDATGQQSITKKPYYFSSKILAKGINEFSVDVGVPRYNYGLYSNDYDDATFASGAIRYGYSNSLTLSGGAEASTDGLSNVGTGFAKNLFGVGVINADLAASQYKDENGYSALVGLEGRISKNISFNTSYRKVFDNYFDLARVSQIRYLKDNQMSAEPQNYLSYSALADEIIRAGINYNFYAGYGVYVGYNQIKYSDNSYKLLSANLSGSLNKNWGFYSSAYKDYENHKDYGIYFALRYTPSTRTNAITSVSSDSGRLTYRQEVFVLSEPKINSFGWGGYVERDQDAHTNNASIYGSYRARAAYLTGRYNRIGDNDQVALSATGSLVAAAGRIFAANEIGDGYAVVTNAGPQSQIINGGINLGTTDKSGRFLIPSLMPYRENHIYLDPSYLPLNWNVKSTDQKTVVGYRQGTLVDFGAHQVVSGLVRIVDKNNMPLLPGYSVRINGQQDALVGYDGEVFVPNLLRQNKLEVDLLDHGSCQVNFTYNSNQYSTKKLGPYICQ